MARDPRDTSDPKTRGRADGVTIAPAPGSRKSLLALTAAATLAALAIAILVLSMREAPRPPQAVEVADLQVAPADAPAQPARATRRARPVPTRVPGAAPAPDVEPAAEATDAAEAPEETPAEPLPYVPSGIGLFPPPGTDPIKVGIIVPEDFELPEGYLRHYQVTDDGKDLPPILMFHPDYDWVDESGHHVDVSEDRIVPPELAPEGLPIEYLEPPAEPGEP